MDSVLVTGGAGMLGARLCRTLLSEGYKVYCLDNLYSSTLANIDDLVHNPHFHFLLKDVTLPLDFEVQYIYNLACPASPVIYQRDPIFTLKTSVWGMFNVLELAGRNGARVLQASTSEVYGDPLVSPQNEEYWGNVNPFGVRSCYDEGKRCAETLCRDFMHHKGVDVRVVRIFNTYGPGMQPNDGRVISNFIVQALSNKDLTVYGHGLQTRSFCFLDDMVDGLIRVMDRKQALESPINLGNPCPITMIDLAEKIISATGSDSKKVFVPLPDDDPRQRLPNIDRASRELGWQPQTSLDEGLDQTIAFFKRILNNNIS